jgi:hypothetical protein
MSPLPIYYPSLKQAGAQGNILWPKPVQFHTRISRNQLPWCSTSLGPYFTCPARGSYPPSFAFRHISSSQQERGTWMNYVPGSSSYSSHGQGRDQNGYTSTGYRGRGRQGHACFHICLTCRDQRIYFKCMVDDLWMDLQPIVFLENYSRH